MGLIELLTAVESIPNIRINEAVKLKDEIIIKYQLDVRKKLKKILNSQDSDENKYFALEVFLQDNWMFIKGTLLSYTAIYNNDATRAICKAAELICDFKNSKLDAKSLPFVPLQFLMPDVELESINNNYPDLIPAELNKQDSDSKRQYLILHNKYVNEPEVEFTEKEKEIVNRWDDFQSRAKYYQDKPGDNVNIKAKPKVKKMLAIKIKKRDEIHLYNKLKTNKELFDRQQIFINSGKYIIKNNFCISNISLEIILKTHLLNEDSSSLIPVSVILEDINLRPYDFACVVFDDQIKKRTNQKIISHSDETLAVYNAMNKLSIAESDQNHFLGNLTELCKQLRFNDSHSGIGRHDNAGKGAYPAIIAFKDYYDALGYQLKEWQDEREFKEGFIYIKFNDNPAEGFSYAVKSKGTGIKQGVIKQEDIEGLFSKDSNVNDNNTGKENSRFYFEKAKNYKEEILKVVIAQGNASLEDEEKNKIPTELKNEIEKLLILSSDLSKNHNATTNLDTCIGTRRESLEKLISSPAQKQLLAQIATSNVFKANLIQDLHGNLQKTKNALQNTLNKADNYQGADLLGISIKLLEIFKVDFKIKDINMLIDITKDLTKNDVLALCEKDAYLKQFIGPIKNNLENLTSFIFDCSEDNLKVLLEAISNKGYITNLFTSVNTLAIVLDCISNNEKANIILKAFGSNLHNIIKSGANFGYALAYLNESQIMVLCTAVKDHLKDIFKSGDDFGLFLRYLDESQITAVCGALKDNLKDVIKSGHDFGCVLKYLNVSKLTMVCVALKDNLKNIIKSGDDFGYTLKYFNEPQITAVCLALKDNLKDIIKSGDDFGRAIKYLNESQKAVVYSSCKDNLKYIIKSGRDFGRAIQHLNAFKIIAVCTALKYDLKYIIKSGYDFGSVLYYLNEIQITAVCTALKDNLKYIIKSGHDFGFTICYLKESQRTAVYTALKDNLKDIIKSGDDFGRAIQYLNESQKTEVYNTLKYNLKNIIISGYNFGMALQYLNDSQKNELCIILKNNLKDMIRSIYDFSYFLKYIDESQMTVVCATLQDNLKDIIKSGHYFGYALQYIPESQIIAICYALKNYLKDVITSGRDFGLVFKYLNERQITAVCTALKDNLKNIIKSGRDFSCVLQYLNESQRTVIYTEFKDNLKDIIKSGKDLGCVLQYLNESQRTIIYTELKDNLKDMIKSRRDFGMIIKCLNDSQKMEICAVLKDNLKDIIKSGDDFRYLFKSAVNERHQKQIYDSFKYHFNTIIHTKSDASIIYNALCDNLEISKIEASFFCLYGYSVTTRLGRNVFAGMIYLYKAIEFKVNESYHKDNNSDELLSAPILKPK